MELEWSKSGSASANLLYKRGEKALREDNPSLAVEHFTALTDHAPLFAEGWHGRARAFFALGEYGLALNDLKQVLALTPRHFGAIYGLGAIMEQIDKPEEAYDAYKILLNLYPAHEKALAAVERLESRVNGTNL
ncbi:tetratricopeptide repeat protein [Lentibacter algarum]|nr:tetratricopeptide repeat protein [Lentibacter algarum]